MDTQIIDVIPIVSRIPLTPTSPPQDWIDEWSRQLFVKVKTDDHAGWGEVLPAAFNSPRIYASFVSRFRDYVVGRRIEDVEEIWETLRKVAFSGGYGVLVGSISGIDIALWDLYAKMKKQYLGYIQGKKEVSITRYASLSRYSRLDDLTRACHNMVNDGFTRIKLHQTKNDTLEAVRRFREEFGYDIELMVDMNASMKLDEATRFANEIRKYEVKWVEEPIWPPDDLLSLREINQIVPVAAGENFFSFYDFQNALYLEAVTYYQPDVTKVGGITPTMKILNLLKEKNAKLSFHSRPHNGWIGVFASIAAANMAGMNAMIETPPNSIPEKYFNYSAKVSAQTIMPYGHGIGIEPIEPLPELSDEKVLIFHN